MSAFFLTILNMSISASWIVLAVLILRLLLKKAPKWITVLLWGIVAIRLICPFTIESALSLIPSKETINPGIMEEQGPVVQPDFPVIDGVENPGIIGGGSPVIGGNPVTGEPVTPAPDPTPVNPVQTVITVSSYVWLVGIAGMLAYTVISYFRVKARIGTAVRLREHIFQSESVVSPFVLGLIKPKIYLPFGMDGQDMEYVIAHENAHIRRKDHWWKPVGFLILTLHWFNPLLWLGYVLLCRDIELACDEKVVKELNFQQKADYSQALLNCSVNRRIIAACPLAFGEVGIKERVKSVLNYKKPAFWIIVVAIVASIVTAVCFLTDPLDKKPDDTTQQTDPSDATENTDPTTPNQSTAYDRAIAAYHAFLNGQIAAIAEDNSKVFVSSYGSISNGQSGFDRYALHDVNGDGIPELFIDASHDHILTFDGKDIRQWYSSVSWMGIQILKNGAVVDTHSGAGSFINYLTFGPDGIEKFISFSGGPGGEAGLYYYGEGKDEPSKEVSKDQWEALTKPYFQQMENKADLEWHTTIPTTPNNGGQSLPAITFRVNSSHPEYTAVVNYSSGNPGVAQSVTIWDPVVKKYIQTISLSGNELFAESVIYAVDVTFDGNLDLLIPYQRPASGAYFQAYVWQESEGQFVRAPQFENLPNFITDTKNNRILSTRTASQITSYSINYYDAEAKDFRPSHSIYWEPDASNNKVHFVEQRYEKGTTVTVKDCLVEKVGDTDINKADPQIAEYFAAGSFWDLDSQKWKNQFYNPTQSGTTENVGATESALLAVLQNKSTFVTVKGTTVYLKDYKPVYQNPDYYESADVFVPQEYTCVDLDKDGKRELIVMGAPYAESYLILREEGQSIYGYSLETRGFQSLKQDGSFQGSGGALIHDYNTISFSKNTYQKSAFAKFYFEADTKKPVADKYGYAPDYEKSVFEINGKPVSLEEIQQFAEAWDNRPNAVWVKVTDTTYTFTKVGLTVHSTTDKSAFSQPISCTYSGKTITLTPHFTGIPVTAVYYSQNYRFNERGAWVNVSTDAGGRDFLVDKNGKIVADSYFQTSTEVPVIPSTIGAEYVAGEGLYVYTDGTLYGLKNSAGTVITKPLYRRTLINFFGGYAVAERADGTFVAIDTTGKEYSTLPGGRSNGDKTFLAQEGAPGNYTQYLYDLQGNRISGGYDSISYFYDGLALVKKGNKLGLISADGTVVLEPCIECDVVTYSPKDRGFSYAFMDQNAFLVPIGGEIAVITVDK